MAEFTREYLLHQAGDVGVPNYQSVCILIAKLHSKMRIELQVVINMCNKFILCLGDYPDRELLLDTPLKKELEKKPNTATRDDSV